LDTITFIEFMQKEWAVIAGAPVAFIIVCCVMTAVVWAIHERIYKFRLESKQASIDFLSTKLEHGVPTTTSVDALKKDFERRLRLTQVELQQQILELPIAASNSPLSRSIQPDVALVWEFSEDERKIKNALGHTEKSIIVHNRSNQYIYNVNIGPIRLSQTLSFETINEIAPATEHVALGRWDGRSSAVTNYLYFFDNDENKAMASGLGWVHKKLHDRGVTDAFLKVPMTLTFDSGGTTWGCEFEFNYDPGEESCFVKRQSTV
jgi:hypothetical protein